MLGLVVSAGAGALAFTKRRVPLAMLLLVPYALLALGAVGATLATTGVLDQVAAAEPNRIPLVAMGGAWNAMMVDWLAWLERRLCSWRPPGRPRSARRWCRAPSRGSRRWPRAVRRPRA
ncbi:MAG: hypothetical protein R3F59_06215 [Myxococcota bacterium]